MNRAALACLLSFSALLASFASAARAGEAASADIYDGKVYGLFEPLTITDSPERIEVSGGTFAIAVDRKTGQIVSAKALGAEFLAAGSALPRPYVGLFPESDPGATPFGGADRPKYSHEKAIAIYPRIWSGGLNAANRYDSAAADSVEVKSTSPSHIIIESRGRYADTPVTWSVLYDVAFDGFTKVTVTAAADKPMLLRWNCFNHVTIADKPVEFIVPWSEPSMNMQYGFNYEYTRSVDRYEVGSLVFGSTLNPFFHLGNVDTGIEFSKETFSDRWAGHKDGRVTLSDGRRVNTGAVEGPDGQQLYGMDARGVRTHFTQVYRRADGFEIEEFDVRDTTVTLNPGEPRTKVFWFQLTPPKTPRQDLNFARLAWPGPHQIIMAGWAEGEEEWSPPSDETVKNWAQNGINIILGGANYFSGDYSHPTHPDKTRHFVETAHKYGMRVIPYVTFSDWNMVAPGYQEHALDWMNSSGTEFRTETSLMCFSAEGWREHFEKEIESLMSQFDFDGLYIDHWESTRGCTNERHGCGGYYLKYSTFGYRDIAERARRVVARHTGGKGIILFNSGEGLFSGILSMFDLRLMGENYDFHQAPETVLQKHLQRQAAGAPGAIVPGARRVGREVHELREHSGTAAPGSDGQNGRRADSRETSVEYRSLVDALRGFGVDHATKMTAFEASSIVHTSTPGVRVIAFVRDGKALLVVGYLPVREAGTPDADLDAAIEAARKALVASGIRDRSASEAAEEMRTTLSRSRRTRGAAEEPKDEVFTDTLEILDPAALGLEASGKYVVQDLLEHRYVETAGAFRDFR